MKHFCNRVLCISIFVSILNFANAQPKEIKIRFIANAGLHITDGKSNIYLDFPYKSGFWIYSKYDKSEIENVKDNSILLFTHKHPDHYKRKLVKRLVRKRGAKAYGPWNLKELDQLNSSIRDFTIQSFKTKHRFSSKHCSYLITWHGKKIYINGDTGDVEPMSKITNMEWAFMPAWTFMNAKEQKLKIDAKMVGLYHVGTKDQINSSNPKIKVINRPGELISIPYE
jgi:L-ascorbate metabolism protein UlaG (beta-lactamase superfamily)